MKRRDIEGPIQRAIADRMTAHGAKWAVVKSIDDVAARLAEWGIGGSDAA